MNDLFELPPHFSGEVRLFPLPNLVLFPSNLQPLHIFESRYREMMEDALHGDHLIAIATLTPGYESEYYSRPPVDSHVCIGRIASHDRKDDGAYDLLLVGIRRARIKDEITPVRSFRRADVEVLQDIDSADEARNNLLGERLIEALRGSIESTDRIMAEFRGGSLSLGTLVDVAAFHLPLFSQQKLELLGETDISRRAERLLGFVVEASDGALNDDDSDPSPGGYAPEFSDN